jgi:hypothetical protein
MVKIHTIVRNCKFAYGGGGPMHKLCGYPCREKNIPRGNIQPYIDLYKQVSILHML